MDRVDIDKENDQVQDVMNKSAIIGDYQEKVRFSKYLATRITILKRSDGLQMLKKEKEDENMT